MASQSRVSVLKSLQINEVNTIEQSRMILRYSCSAISAQLEKTNKTLVSEVDFSIESGKRLALIGETGSGKTMIAQAVMRLLPSNVSVAGETALFCGKPLPTARKMKRLLGVDIVYIPQNGLEFLDPSRTIRKQLYDNLKKIGLPSRELECASIEKLLGAGLHDAKALLDKYSFQLSGGMAQRVAIALAACSAARLVIADEPTNGLDFEIRLNFQELLSQMFPNAARLVITHDIAIAETCDDVLVLCRGKMMERGAVSQVLSSPRHPYTQVLLDSQVKRGMRESPVLRDGAGECPFYRRCDRASDACLTERKYHNENGTEWWCCHT